jgi:hypothetical protein
VDVDGFSGRAAEDFDASTRASPWILVSILFTIFGRRRQHVQACDDGNDVWGSIFFK